MRVSTATGMDHVAGEVGEDIHRGVMGGAGQEEEALAEAVVRKIEDRLLDTGTATHKAGLGKTMALEGQRATAEVLRLQATVGDSNRQVHLRHQEHMAGDLQVRHLRQGMAEDHHVDLLQIQVTIEEQCGDSPQIRATTGKHSTKNLQANDAPRHPPSSK